MGDSVVEAYFSVLRWRNDATRDEAKNVAIILVEPEGQFAAMRAASVSTISRGLHEQGLLDALLSEMAKKFAAEKKPTLGDLRDLHKTLERSLYLTEPQRVSVPDVNATVSALYKAYVAPRLAPPAGVTKGKVLDRSVEMLRRRGLTVKRGQYLGDFIFDMVIPNNGHPTVAEVLSFGTTNKNWTPVEFEAGHFLYALEQLPAHGIAVVQPPLEHSPESAAIAFRRVAKWFQNAEVQMFEPSELATANFAQ